MKLHREGPKTPGGWRTPHRLWIAFLPSYHRNSTGDIGGEGTGQSNQLVLCGLCRPRTLSPILRTSGTGDRSLGTGWMPVFNIMQTTSPMSPLSPRCLVAAAIIKLHDDLTDAIDPHCPEPRQPRLHCRPARLKA